MSRWNLWSKVFPSAKKRPLARRSESTRRRLKLESLEDRSLLSTLAFSTYMGGSSDDRMMGVAVDSSGNSYVAGSTTSSNLPATAGAFQSSNAGGASDVFVAKYLPN